MMRIAEALEAFRPHRGDALVVPGRGGRYWVEQTSHPELDAPLGDPAMGGHAGFGLGLALARPEPECCSFGGDILIGLGMLTTIAEQAPANFYHFLLDSSATRRPAGLCRMKTWPMTNSPGLHILAPMPSGRSASRANCRRSSGAPARCLSG